MPLLEVKDPATGSIKPWVWVLGAGFAIGGAALFLGSGQGGGSGGAGGGTEGLGTSGGLDELQEALEALNDRIDALEPNPPGTSPPPGGGGGSNDPPDQPYLPWRPPRGVPTPTDGFRESPTTGGIGIVSPTSDSSTSRTGGGGSGSIGIVNPFAGSTRTAPSAGGVSMTNPFTAPTQSVSNITKVISGSTIGAVTVTRSPTSALEPTSGRVTRRTSAVSTGSINPYPISFGVNPASPEACRRSPVHSDI